VNFARLGLDIANAFFEASYLLTEEYHYEIHKTSSHPNSTVETQKRIFSTDCASKKLNVKTNALNSEIQIFNHVSASAITIQAFETFIEEIEDGHTKETEDVPHKVLINLRRMHHHYWIKNYDTKTIFALSLLQRNCRESITKNKTIDEEHYKKS
jgi:hypothetical protein